MENQVVDNSIYIQNCLPFSEGESIAFSREHLKRNVSLVNLDGAMRWYRIESSLNEVLCYVYLRNLDGATRWSLSVKIGELSTKS